MLIIVHNMVVTIISIPHGNGMSVFGSVSLLYLHFVFFIYWLYLLQLFPIDGGFVFNRKQGYLKIHLTIYVSQHLIQWSPTLSWFQRLFGHVCTAFIVDCLITWKQAIVTLLRSRYVLSPYS